VKEDLPITANKINQRQLVHAELCKALYTAVFFNWGSTEPKGSTSGIQWQWFSSQHKSAHIM